MNWSICKTFFHKESSKNLVLTHNVPISSLVRGHPSGKKQKRTWEGCSPSSWPHCCGTLLSPGAAAGWWFLSPPPGCSLSPAAETPSPQTFWFLFPTPLHPDGGPHTTSAVTSQTHCITSLTLKPSTTLRLAQLLTAKPKHLHFCIRKLWKRFPSMSEALFGGQVKAHRAQSGGQAWRTCFFCSTDTGVCGYKMCCNTQKVREGHV